MKEIFLSVVIPAYNEEKSIKKGVLDSVYNYLKKQNFTWEVVIVDDASEDNTADLVSNFLKKHKGFRLLREPHRGKGGTVIKGVLESKGKIVLFTDMDQSTPINQIEKFLEKFTQGFDVVIGSRHGRPGQPIIRKIMAYGWVLLRNILLKLPLKDTQCGFKAFKKDKVIEILKRMKVYTKDTKVKGAAVTAGFDLELLYVAKKLGLKIAEVPVEWFDYGERKEVSPLKDSWEGLRDLLKVWINEYKGKYDI